MVLSTEYSVQGIEYRVQSILILIEGFIVFLRLLNQVLSTLYLVLLQSFPIQLPKVVSRNRFRVIGMCKVSKSQVC
jgi:hypothetical protein